MGLRGLHTTFCKLLDTSGMHTPSLYLAPYRTACTDPVLIPWGQRAERKVSRALYLQEELDGPEVGHLAGHVQRSVALERLCEKRY